MRGALQVLAVGLADDALTTVMTALPVGKQIVLGPAMNTEMWNNPVIQRNLGWLKELDRFIIVDPTVKRLACGDFGAGGLAEPADQRADVLAPSEVSARLNLEFVGPGARIVVRTGDR